MANVNLTPEKITRRKQLFRAGIETLEQQGWRVERIPGLGKASVRRILKGDTSRIVAIRTTQDQWIAFPRKSDDKGWVTLSEVDAVVAVSVDDRDNPKFALVHMIEGDDMRERFDRAYSARVKAGYSIPWKRGIWISLYDDDANEPVTHVGAGAGLANAPISRVPIQGGQNGEAIRVEPQKANDDHVTLSFDRIVAEAKGRLALTLGVDASSIKITVEA
jgi:hypothetical protein